MPSDVIFLPGPMCAYNTGALRFVPTATDASGVLEGFVDQCTAVYCPVNSVGYDEQWSGAPDACRCNAGYFGPPVCDSAINGYSSGCTPCTPVVNAMSVTCDQADDSRAVCETGFYITTNSGTSDTCTRAFCPFLPSHTTLLFHCTRMDCFSCAH